MESWSGSSGVKGTKPVEQEQASSILTKQMCNVRFQTVNELKNYNRLQNSLTHFEKFGHFFARTNLGFSIYVAIKSNVNQSLEWSPLQ